MTPHPDALSPARRVYLKTKRRRNRLVLGCQLGFLIAFFVVWELAAQLGWIDSFILSQPSGYDDRTGVQRAAYAHRRDGV